MLLIAVLRATLGIAIIGAALLGLVFSFMMEGVGCAGTIALAVFFIAEMIAYNTIGDEAVEAFLGMPSEDYMAIVLITGVGGFMFSMTHIAGIATSLAVGFTGLLVTGFLDSATIATLSQGVLDVGIVVMLPIVLPMVIVIVVVGLAFRSH